MHQHPHPSPEPPWFDVPTLCRIAAEHGYPDVTSRTLEGWRHQRLLPALQKVGQQSRRAVWASPPGTDTHLLALCRWRKQVPRDLDAVRLLLWLEGFPQQIGEVRRSLIAALDRTLARLNRQVQDTVERLSTGGGATVDQARVAENLADEAAGRRGPRSAAPRTVRQSHGDRTQAIALMLRAFMFGEDVAVTADQARQVERLLGLTPGRRDKVQGQGPWLTGPPQLLFDVARFAALPTLVEVARTATDGELQAAWRTVHALFVGLPLLAQTLGAAFGGKNGNFTGLGGLSQLDEHPEAVLLLLPLAIAADRQGLGTPCTASPPRYKPGCSTRFPPWPRWQTSGCRFCSNAATASHRTSPGTWRSC